MLNTNTKRILWIDAAKGIGLLCVILGHLQVPYAATWVYTFHMPLFFFLSGVVFSGEKYDFVVFLKKKLKTLVLPYFTLGGVIFAFFCVVYAVQGQPVSAYFVMLRDFLTQEHFWTVWFLACLFLVEVLYYGLHRALGKSPLSATMASALLCGFGLLRYRLGWGSLPWNLDVALVAQFFFHMGYLSREMLSKMERRLSKSPLKKAFLALVLFGVNIITGFLCIRVSGSSLDMSVGLYGNEILTFLSAFTGIFAVILVSQTVPHKYLVYLGRNTMIIFAWHSRIVIVLCGYIYACLGVLQSRTLPGQLLYAAATFVMILGILIPVTEFIKRSKAHALFGV